jgi:hypothetical protein
LSGAHEWCFTWVDFGLTHKHQTKLERFAEDKHNSLFSLLQNIRKITVVKSFITIVQGANIIKLLYLL